MGLLKFILYAVIFYYCFLFLSRYVLSFFLKKWVNKMNQNFNQKKKKNNYQEHSQGETVIQYKDDKKVDPGGEYVEFEDLNNE